MLNDKARRMGKKPTSTSAAGSELAATTPVRDLGIKSHKKTAAKCSEQLLRRPQKQSSNVGNLEAERREQKRR